MIRVKTFPYDLTLSHNTTVTDDDRRTDRRTTIVPIARPLLKYGLLKSRLTKTQLKSFVDFSQVS